MKKVHLLYCFLFFFSCNCESGKPDLSEGKPVTNNPAVKETKEPRTYVMKGQEAATKPVPNRAVAQKPKAANDATSQKLQEVTKPSMKKMVAEAKAQGMTDDEIQRKIVSRGDDIVAAQPPVNSKPQLGVGLPATCQFLSQQFLGKYFNTDAEALEVKDASSQKTKYVKSCFFKWDNGIIVNSGMFLQIQENPFPGEIPNYASSFIASKKEKGEQMMGDEITMYEYKDYDAGDGGCYSAEQGKFFWRIGDEHVFMLAFNLGMDKKSEFKYAKDLIREIMKNYNKAVKK